MKNKESLLDPRLYINAIKSERSYAEAYGGDYSNAAELIIKRKAAIKLGALAASETLRLEYGTYDPKPRIMRLVSQLDDFSESKQRLENYSANAGGHINETKKQQIKHDKETVISFNHSLREVIETNNRRFNFAELVTFMTNMHSSIEGPENQKHFHDLARRTIVGVRNEIATEQVLLQYSDYSFEMADEEADLHGADLIIEGVPFDIKASKGAADRAKDDARKYGRDPNLIVWSHIREEDFEGQLLLPNANSSRIAQELIQDIDKGIDSYHSQYSVTQIY